MWFFRYRTQFSRLLGILFLTLCAFSGRRLEQYPCAEGAMFALGCTLAGLGAVGRLWCAQYIAGYKDEVLVEDGPYSLCRNPLYFFSFLGALGVGFCTESLTLAAVVLLAFALMYPAVIRHEERTLLTLFGERYLRYMQQVPAFWPKFSNFREPRNYTVRPETFRNEVFNAVWFLWIVGILELFESLGEGGALPRFFSLW
ncbi:MAG: methyltransferase family protein [Pyramidobacter sp.]|jgi:protein-S-isoprenylcysteine O-methyltransferase Ste14